MTPDGVGTRRTSARPLFSQLTTQILTIACSPTAELGLRILGATAAAATAVGDAIAHAPEAPYDYAKETWAVDPDEIARDRTFKPWKSL